MDDELEQEIREVLRGYSEMPLSEPREHLHHWKYQVNESLVVRGCLYCGNTWVCSLKKYPHRLDWHRIYEEGE